MATPRAIRTLVLAPLLVTVLSLSACGGADGSGASGSVSANAASITPAAATAPTTTTIAANQVPVISGTPATAVTVGTAYDFQPTASDADGDALTFSAQGLPTWASLDASTGHLTGIPADADVGQSADIVISVSDTKASASLAAFRITINARVSAPPTAPAGSLPPTIGGSPATSVVAGSAYSFTPMANDPDSHVLTFAIANKPGWASFSTATGQLTGVPARTQVGTYAGISISVTDGNTTVTLPAFSVQVTAPPNTPPTITGNPATSVTAGSAYSFTPAAADVDQQTLGFSIANKPAWASFSTATGTLSGTPTSSSVGTFAGIVISVSDGQATTSLPAFTLTVQAAPNQPPVISGTPATTVVAGGTYSFTPTASDPDGNTLTFAVSGKPSWASFDATTGRLSGTPTAANVGSYGNIVISVSDGTVSTALAAFGIAVSGVTTGSATLSWTPPTQNTDGSALGNLAGYRVYYGPSATALTTSIQLANAGLTSYVVSNLTSGTYYFAITAYNSAGAESAMSNVGSKTIL